MLQAREQGLTTQRQAICVGEHEHARSRHKAFFRLLLAVQAGKPWQWDQAKTSNHAEAVLSEQFGAMAARSMVPKGVQAVKATLRY